MINKAVNELRTVTTRSTGEEKNNALSLELAKLYTPAHVASMLTDRYPQLPQLQPHVDTILEAAAVFRSGFRRASVALLVTVVEGVLSKMLLRMRGSGEGKGTELLKQTIEAEIARATDNLVCHGHWVPPEYRKSTCLKQFDEYVYMLATFEDFGTIHLFAKTSTFKSSLQLNRHGILGSSTKPGVAQVDSESRSGTTSKAERWRDPGVAPCEA